MNANSVLLAAAVPLCLTPASDDLAYRPAEGLEVRKVFSEEASWTLASVSQVVDGNELDVESPDMEGRVEREVELLDALVEAGDGRPGVLRRTFTDTMRNVAIDVAAEGFEAAYDFELETPLDGETVVFRWDEDGEDWAVEADDGVDAELIAGLREDADLRALLPGEGVSEGDRWTVDAATLADVFRAGGNLGFTRDERPDGPYIALTPTDVIAVALITVADAAQELDGEATLQWNETVEEDGARLAVIEVRVDASLSADLTDELRRIVEDSDSTGKRDPALVAAWDLAGDGELVWNLTAGRFESFELTLEGTAGIDSSWTQGDASTYEVTMEAVMDCRTTLSAKARVE